MSTGCEFYILHMDKIKKFENMTKCTHRRQYKIIHQKKKRQYKTRSPS